MTSSNPYLKRLLGETAPVEEPLVEQPPPPESEPNPESVPQSSGKLSTAAPQTQELIQLWQRGDHMAVAARLMFTEASYADFVDLVFAIGQSAGRELGQLLDELADTEGIEPPQTPPEYSNLLQRVATADQEEDLL